VTAKVCIASALVGPIRGECLAIDNHVAGDLFVRLVIVNLIVVVALFRHSIVRSGALPQNVTGSVWLVVG
jgi:hypothetical protein